MRLSTVQQGTGFYVGGFEFLDPWKSWGNVYPQTSPRSTGWRGSYWYMIIHSIRYFPKWCPWLCKCMYQRHEYNLAWAVMRCKRRKIQHPPPPPELTVLFRCSLWQQGLIRSADLLNWHTLIWTAPLMAQVCNPSYSGGRAQNTGHSSSVWLQSEFNVSLGNLVRPWFNIIF